MRTGRLRAGFAGALASGLLMAAACTTEPQSISTASGGRRPPTSTPVSLPPPSDPCVPDAVFSRETLLHGQAASRVFYSWTAADDAAELRKTRLLFSRTGRAGLGPVPRYAADRFAELAGDGDEQALVASVLAGDAFARSRSAWPSAWATRMGWPGETPRTQLLRIELRPEAFIVTFYDQTFRVVDLSNRPIALAEVLAAPERIGAVYFAKDEQECKTDGGSRRDAGDGSPGCVADGYREFILGSEAMVAEWSLGTETIRAEIERGMELFQAFRGRASAIEESSEYWSTTVVRHWRSGAQRNCFEEQFYEDAIAIPSRPYEPLPDNLQHIVDTLRDASFSLDPLVVRPGADGG
ncbi:MAG: hypothetical protein U0270_08875 [Labilithrix sp.]